MINQTIKERILQRRHQYLIHSYLYYEMDFSIISDDKFKSFCDELIELQIHHPVLCESIPYHDICNRLDSAYTSPTIYDPQFEYPNNIISRAVHSYARNQNIRFSEAASQFGFTTIRIPFFYTS